MPSFEVVGTDRETGQGVRTRIVATDAADAKARIEAIGVTVAVVVLAADDKKHGCQLDGVSCNQPASEGNQTTSRSRPWCFTLRGAAIIAALLGLAAGGAVLIYGAASQKQPAVAAVDGGAIPQPSGPSEHPLLAYIQEVAPEIIDGQAESVWLETNPNMERTGQSPDGTLHIYDYAPANPLLSIRAMFCQNHLCSLKRTVVRDEPEDEARWFAKLDRLLGQPLTTTPPSDVATGGDVHTYRAWSATANHHTYLYSVYAFRLTLPRSGTHNYEAESFVDTTRAEQLLRNAPMSALQRRDHGSDTSDDLLSDPTYANANRIMMEKSGCQLAPDALRIKIRTIDGLAAEAKLSGGALLAMYRESMAVCESKGLEPVFALDVLSAAIASRIAYERQMNKN